MKTEVIKNDEGQSTIEFIVTFIFVISFFLTFFKLALNSTNGFLLHYATFMSSRAYLVSDINSNTAAGGDSAANQVAQKVFKEYQVTAFIPVGPTSVEINAPDTGKKSVFTGVIARYTDKFTVSKFFGGENNIQYVSESFIGREPTRGECSERVCKAMRDVGADCSLHVTFYDNGC
jgi:hypothetical protein